MTSILLCAEINFKNGEDPKQKNIFTTSSQWITIHWNYIKYIS